MNTEQSTSLVIREHNFQEAKNSLKKYTEQAKKDVELSRVPYDGGLFNLGNHKVTGTELNRITSQIQDYLISLNNLSQGLVDEFGQVYRAFESLDKDYIAGIVTSIKAAEEVSKKEQQDRRDIKELVEQHKQSIAVLKKFKTDIEKLKHLTDIDKAWELIEKQSKLSKELSNYMAELSKVKHIKDVDAIYADLQKVSKEFVKVSEQQTKYSLELTSIREYCDVLSELKHIKDIDKLWDDSKALFAAIKCIDESLNLQGKALSEFESAVQAMQNAQQDFSEDVKRKITDFRDDINSQVKELADNQAKKLTEIEDAHTKSFNQFCAEQREILDSAIKEQSATLGSIEKTQQETLEKLSLGQSESLAQIANEQAVTLGNIERTHNETLERLSKSQAEVLEQLSKEQSDKWSETIKKLEDEKAVLNEQVTTIAQKAKYAYFVAGGAAALTLLQFVLNVLGII